MSPKWSFSRYIDNILVEGLPLVGGESQESILTVELERGNVHRTIVSNEGNGSCGRSFVLFLHRSSVPGSSFAGTFD